MKLAIVTSVWQRPALSQIVLSYYRDLCRGFDITLICAGSEGDASRRLVEGCGWHYVEAPNQPLSQKFNAVVEAARAFEVDAVLMTGSDDLHSARYIDNARNIDTSIAQMRGLKDLYFYDIRTHKCLRHRGFIGSRAYCSIGAGRVLTRPALELLEWRPWGKETINRGLDLTLSYRLKKRGIQETALPMQELGISVDIKTGTNLTSMATFGFNGEDTDPDVLRSFGLLDQLNALT